ncbi:MAG: cyclic peptide export ABC transporter [Opitutales bacterium]|nr:cyclic peptide export ABC transporter [Opitutales bacterium]
MLLYKFLINHCRLMVVITIIAALFSGLFNAGLLALINHLISASGDTTKYLALVFGLLVFGKIATGLISQVFLIRFSQQAIADLRRTIVAKVLKVPLSKFEKIGPGRVMATLTDDIERLSTALFTFPLVVINIAVLIGGSIYLGYLSLGMLMAIGVLMVVGAVCYRILILQGFRSLRSARESGDQLFGHFRSLSEGLKELKLHRQRRTQFLERDLHNTTADFQRYSVAAEIRFILAHNWTHLLFFVLIGLILFLGPVYNDMDLKTLTGYILTVLYLMGPFSGVMGSVSVFSRAEVALRKIDKLGVTLGDETQMATACEDTVPKNFNNLELRGVSHIYPDEHGDDTFTLGPLDLSFQAGELIYLVGGNGSGKSTLAKIITGLYAPDSGEIRLDGQCVNDSTRDNYRQLFSAVFSDFHLFEELLGLKAIDLDDRANDYLNQLHLEHKVSVTDGHLSTVSLSQGQRKRLALLTAYLEDRPFYLFDEWAADQDPYFKNIFYHQLLPELQKRGKTIFVITHDDSYFHLADRVIKLESGQIQHSEEAYLEHR